MILSIMGRIREEAMLNEGIREEAMNIEIRDPGEREVRYRVARREAVKKREY